MERMAYNEERNIGQGLTALLAQQTSKCQIDEILVLASGCTRTSAVEIVSGYCLTDPRIKLVVEAERKGKASAVNLFLRHATSDVLVMESADTLPEPTTIERLLEPMCGNPDIGMTGGHPVPINDKSTFMGYAVHPPLAVAPPNRYQKTQAGRAHRLPPSSLPHPLQLGGVDEANMEPLITGQGYQLLLRARGHSLQQGAETVHDFLKQRRRIHAGHLRMSREQGYTVATMGSGPILSAILANFAWDWRYFCWTPAVIGLEVYGRYLGWMDYRLKKRSHAIWDIAVTTKGEVTGSDQ